MDHIQSTRSRNPQPLEHAEPSSEPTSSPENLTRRRRRSNKSGQWYVRRKYSIRKPKSPRPASSHELHRAPSSRTRQRAHHVFDIPGPTGTIPILQTRSKQHPSAKQPPVTGPAVLTHAEFPRQRTLRKEREPYKSAKAHYSQSQEYSNPPKIRRLDCSSQERQSPDVASAHELGVAGRRRHVSWGKSEAVVR